MWTVEGEITENDAIRIFIFEALNLALVDVEACKKQPNPKSVDGESIRGIIIPKLLELMGAEAVILEPNGHFPHNPEPLKEHLTDIRFSS
jgi:phosphomannomutase